MDSDAPASNARKFRAFVWPMAAFLLLLVLNSALKSFGRSFWFTSAEYWIYPLQTVLCAVVLWRHRREYGLRPPARILFAIGVAIAVFAVWIAPQVAFGFAPRRDGFNPDVFAAQPLIYWVTVGLRFLRLVVIVPLVEEIFWRGFLLRYLINEKFWRVAVGTFSWWSFGVVATAFALTHAMADWPAALICGALYNCVAYRTKSLTSCVIAHAATNLLLGIWIMQTREWGFW